MKKFAVASLFLIVVSAALAVASRASVTPGVPIIRNFPRTTYGGGAQNWAIAQDSLDRLYVGNRLGLMAFDGHQWALWKLPNYSTVRSIHIDNARGRVYCGGSEEFGYFDLTRPGVTPPYVSLVPTINIPGTSFTEVWNIYNSSGKIWFQSDFKIMKWDGDKTTSVISVSDKITASAIINGRFLAGLMHGGVVEITETRAIPVAGTDELRGKRIVSIIPSADPKSDVVFIVTAFNGVYRLEGSRLSKEPGFVNDYLRENQAFSCAYDRKSGQYAFGTVAGGVILAQPDSSAPLGYTYTFIDNSDGLQNNTVLNMAFDNNANLWLALDDGLDYLVCNTAITRLAASTAEIGAGYASLVAGNDLLLGTNRGLFKIPFTNTVSSKPEPVLRSQVWFLNKIGETIFCGGDATLWTGTSAGSFTPVEGVGGSWWVSAIPGDPARLLASTYEGFVMLERDAAGKWRMSHPIAGYRDSGGRFVVEKDGTVWLAHWLHGIYRLKLSPDRLRFERVDLLTTKNGLPGDRNNSVSVYKGRPVFATDGGFYDFNRRSGRFVPDTALNAIFRFSPRAHLYTAPDNSLWSVSPDNVWMARMTAGKMELDSISYQPLGSLLIPGFDNFNFIDGDRTIVSSQEGFFLLDEKTRLLADKPSPLFINRISAPGDSIVYTATEKTLAPANVFSLPFDLNSLKFEATMPEYRAVDAVIYSFMLENYDDDWSVWSTNNTKEYTQLREGTYTLRVRARDNYNGHVAETAFTFSIRPPWYRSTIAYIIYAALLIALGLFLYRSIRDNAARASRELADRKEKELNDLKRESEAEALKKDYQIAHLKSEQLEHDIRHKSEELSNITMNVIRKNEILLDISARLTKMQKGLDAGADNAEHSRRIAQIQSLIQHSISHDDDWRNFTRNFDVVYENYTKRLTEQFPELTPGDLRICCYLKMGLSSKEIAPLFNISYRSVEMTRYRLRKKLGIGRDTNLVDFLQKI